MAEQIFQQEKETHYKLEEAFPRVIEQYIGEKAS